MQYRLHTLVDITNTGQYRNELGKEQARHQQQNFDTLLNTIGMRCNLNFITPPRVIEDIPQKYGLSGNDQSKIWVFDWRTEAENTFAEDDDYVALLKRDFALVPYINNLTETSKFKTCIFMPSVNINFEMLR